MRKNIHGQRTEHDFSKKMNEHIAIYEFKLVDGEEIFPLAPIEIKNDVGPSLHYEILIPEDFPLPAIMKVMDLFETIYPSYYFEFNVTCSKTIKENYLTVCLVNSFTSSAK